MKKKNGLKRVLAAVAVAAIALTGCTSAQASDNVLRVAVKSESTGLNSLTVSYAVDAQIIGNFTEGLTTYSDTGAIVGSIAESWTVSDDQLTYTFKLRDDANWEDGTPVTANDFVFAWQQVATLPDSSYKQHLSGLVNGVAVAKGEQPADALGVEAVSDKELKVSLIQPNAYFLDLVAFPSFLPVNEAFYNKVGAEAFGTSKETVLANGPFTLSEYQGDLGYTLKKNDKYWDADSVKIDGVDVRVVKQAETQASLYDSGEIDSLLLTADLSEKYANVGETIVTEMEPRIGYFYLSGTTATPAPLLENKNFRAAIAHAIDKDLITKNVLRDGSIPVEYMIPEGLVDVNGKDFRQFSNQLNTPIFDVTKAQSYLEAAKAELGDTPLTITFTTTDSDANKKLYENIQNQIETNLPGVTFTITTIPEQTYYPTIGEHTTPAASLGWAAGYRDPSTFMEIFQTGQGHNYSQYSNSAYDALIKETTTAEQAVNPEARMTTFAEAEAVLIGDYNIIPLYQQGKQSISKPYVKNLVLSPTIPSYFYKFVSIER